MDNLEFLNLVARIGMREEVLDFDGAEQSRVVATLGRVFDAEYDGLSEEEVIKRAVAVRLWVETMTAEALRRKLGLPDIEAGERVLNMLPNKYTPATVTLAFAIGLLWGRNEAAGGL